MSGLTWARNESDDRASSMNEMFDTFLKIKTRHQERFGKPLKAVKLSRLTLLALPLIPAQDANAITSFYGVPVEIDDSLALWDFKEVYA